MTPFVLIFGALFFFFSARFLLKDESRCKHALGGSESALSSNGISIEFDTQPQPAIAYDNDSYLHVPLGK